MLVPNNTNQYIKFDEREDYPVWQELKALFAQKSLELEFEVVPADQYPTTLQTRIASGTDLPDIVCLTPFDDAAAMDLANKGTIQPINTIMDEYGDGTFNRFIHEKYPFMHSSPPRRTAISTGTPAFRHRPTKTSPPPPAASSTSARTGWRSLAWKRLKPPRSSSL